MSAAGRRLGLALALATSAVAAPAAALEVSFTGSIGIHIGLFPPITIAGGGVAEASTNQNGHITRIDMPAGLFATQALTAPVTDPNAAPVRGIFAGRFANATGVFARDAEDHLGGSMPLRGDIKVCLFAPCSYAIANLTVPASVIGHLTTADLPGAVNLTVRGAPWTTGPVDATPHPVTGSDGGLDLNLVTPIFVSTNIAPSAVVKSYGVLDFSIISLAGDHCKNGFDDDGDGFADYPDDPGCSSPEDQSERSDGAPCDDGIDQDGDLRIDANDPGCDGPSDPSERSDLLPCDNGLDDDGDGLIEPDDLGCSGPADPSERGTIACDDGIDTDGDGLIEPFDPGCSGPTDTSERGPGRVCDDGIDDDGDGASDFPADTGCASIDDPSEHTAAHVCDDGVDNDGDGTSDFAVLAGAGDPGCSSTTDTSEKSALLVCDDGLDNDFDGTSDVPNDPGCAFPSDASEQSASLPCDNGLDDDGDLAIDSQQDVGCTGPGDPREAVDFADGGFHFLTSSNSPGDGVYVDDASGYATSLRLAFDATVAGDLSVAGTSFARIEDAAITGNLVALDAAAVEIEGAAIGGHIEARDGATISIFGSGFDLPLGLVTATVGTIVGFLADGTPFAWDFVRDASASIVLAPEPASTAATVAALVALGALRRRRR